MAFDVKATLEAVLTYLQKDGKFRRAQIGEFKSLVIGNGLAAACWMSRAVVTKVYVGGNTEESHVVTVRVYRDWLGEPAKDVELDVAQAVSRITSDLVGEYDLGATIREVDVAGANGTPMGAEFGHVQVADKMYRVADITVPLNVDGSATAAA